MCRDTPQQCWRSTGIITERRRLEQAAQADHAETVAHLAFLQQVIDALPSSVYLVYGADARLLLANRAATSLWGAEWHIDQPMQEFLATHGIRIMDAQGRPLALTSSLPRCARCRGGDGLHHQETIRRPNGSSLPVLVNAVALDSSQEWHAVRQPTGPLAQHTQHADTEPLRWSSTRT